LLARCSATANNLNSTLAHVLDGLGVRIPTPASTGLGFAI
jgi:hypothetical protein